MREYGKTKNANWISPRLSGCARIIAAYLFGGPHCNWIGCFNCPPHYAAVDMELPLAKVKKAYAELFAEGFIKPFRNMICLVNFFAIEKVDNPNVATARFREFTQLPDGKHKAFVAHEMLTHFGQHLNAEQKSQLVDLTSSEPLPEPLPEPLANLSPNRDRDRDRDRYKSKAQQQLIRPGASAVPLPTPGNGSLAENFPTPPQPRPDAEPANGPQAVTDLLAKATQAIASEGPHTADRLPEEAHPTPAPPTPPELCPAPPDTAGPAVDPDTDPAEVWRRLTTSQRHVVAEAAGAVEPAACAITEWWQFPEEAQQRLIHTLHTLRHHRLNPHDPSGAEPPADHTAVDSAIDRADIDIAALWDGVTVEARRKVLKRAGAADPDAGAQRVWAQLNENAHKRLPPVLLALLEEEPAHSADPLLLANTDEPGAEETTAEPDSHLAPVEASSAPVNEVEKGIIHDDPGNARNDETTPVSETPSETALNPVADAVDLSALGVPESIDAAVWQHFESMAREKVRWSAGMGATLIRQLQQAMDNGADGNALLEWATVRRLLDLPDAWRRMQADADKAAKQRHTESMLTEEVAVAEPVDETVSEGVTGTVSQTVSEGVTGTLAETVTAEKPSNGKKKKAKREANKPHDVSEETWADFVEHRKNRKSLITNRVVEQFRKQAQKAHISLEEALQITVTRGWIGFEAEWLEKNKRMQPAGNVAAHLTPNAGGRLPGESAVDFSSLRLYMEDQQKQAANGTPPAIGLFNHASALALPHINRDTAK